MFDTSKLIDVFQNTESCVVHSIRSNVKNKKNEEKKGKKMDNSVCHNCISSWRSNKGKYDQRD